MCIRDRNKAADYLYSKNLVPTFHLFITPTEIIIKYPTKSPEKKRIIELTKKIKNVYKGGFVESPYDEGFNYYSQNNYCYWKINLPENDFLIFSNTICELQKLA